MAFLQTISGVRLCWELEEPKGPQNVSSIESPNEPLKYALPRLCNQNGNGSLFSIGAGRKTLAGERKTRFQQFII